MLLTDDSSNQNEEPINIEIGINMNVKIDINTNVCNTKETSANKENE